MQIKILTPLLVSCIALYGCREPVTVEKNVSLLIPCSGFCFVQNDDSYEVSAPFSGTILSLFQEQGRQVRNGDRMAIIENPDLITLQQDYLDSKNMLEYFSGEYTRQGELTVENATSIKKMQIARRDFQSAELRYQALRKQIAFLGLNPDSLRSEKIRSTLIIRSRQSGIVACIHARKGSYVERGKKIYDLVSKQTLLLKLFVPETSYDRICMNQQIEVCTVADTLHHFNALILSVSDSIDPVTGMATVIAQPVNDSIRIVPGMSVKANIITGLPKQ